MPRFKFIGFALILCVLLGVMPQHKAGAESAVKLAEQAESIGANIIFMRHALAPGFGDPAHFNIHDCATQRNLDAEGQQQAIRTGAFLAQTEIGFDQILSSRWCRCTQTAALLGLGAFTTFDGLNSFFDGHVSREETLALLTDFLDKTPQQKMVLLVTHQVVISAITGISPPSGGLVLYNHNTGEAARFSVQ